MTNSIERRIADGLVTIMGNRSWISTNSIPVTQNHDRITEKDDLFVIVHPNPNERVAPNYPFYSVEVDIVAMAMKKADPDGDRIDQLIHECEAMVQTLTAAALSTTSTLSIDGIVPLAGSEVESEDGHFTLFSARLKVALTHTFT